MRELASWKFTPGRTKLWAITRCTAFTRAGANRRGFSGYFVAVFDTPFSSSTWNGNITTASSKTRRAQNRRWGLRGFCAQSRVVRVKIGTSFTSSQRARKNLQAEIPGFDFAKVKVLVPLPPGTTPLGKFR